MRSSSARQLDRIVARSPDHLVITGDLLDRWQPALLDPSLDALGERGLLAADRVTILHGNHDLASSGGHPREPGDLRRLALRFWDPPPVLALRRRRFYRRIEARAPGAAAPGPFLKPLANGVALAVVDTVPFPWRRCRFAAARSASITLEGRFGRRRSTGCRGCRLTRPLVLLTHHYPLEIPPYQWRKPHAVRPPRHRGRRGWIGGGSWCRWRSGNRRSRALLVGRGDRRRHGGAVRPRPPRPSSIGIAASPLA